MPNATLWNFRSRAWPSGLCSEACPGHFSAAIVHQVPLNMVYNKIHL